MMAAYVDTSWLTAIAFAESSHTRSVDILTGAGQLLCSGLVEAEVRSVCRREGVSASSSLVDRLTLIMPDRSLRPEIERILEVGYLRGADLWHIACALFVSPTPADLVFLTLDARQAGVAQALGFVVPGDAPET